MAIWTYETVNPTPISNVVVEKAYADGVHKLYRLQAIDGYVLHDNVGEYVDENGETVLMFATGTCTCAANYDFVVNPREFYAIPESDVPENSFIYGVGDNNNHEVM